MLGDEFYDMENSDREKKVIDILNEENFNLKQKMFQNDVNYDELMNVSQSKKSGIPVNIITKESNQSNSSNSFYKIMNKNFEAEKRGEF